jgi:hypothetical protein
MTLHNIVLLSVLSLLFISYTKERCTNSCHHREICCLCEILISERDGSLV